MTMKLIDVLTKLSGDEIENGTILTINDGGRYRQYKYIDGSCFLDDHNSSLPLNIYGKNDLNSEVELIPPKQPKKYYLRLDKDEESNYINLNLYDSYLAATKDEFFGYKTKFTQEEIDSDKFLKFIEKYGVKEEVE